MTSLQDRLRHDAWLLGRFFQFPAKDRIALQTEAADRLDELEKQNASLHEVRRDDDRIIGELHERVRTLETALHEIANVPNSREAEAPVFLAEALDLCIGVARQALGEGLNESST